MQHRYFQAVFVCCGSPGVAGRCAPGGTRVVSTPAASGRENLYARFTYVVMSLNPREVHEPRCSLTATAVCEMSSTNFGERPFHALRCIEGKLGSRTTLGVYLGLPRSPASNLSRTSSKASGPTRVPPEKGYSRLPTVKSTRAISPATAATMSLCDQVFSRPNR
jgi:hypothetical protein